MNFKLDDKKLFNTNDAKKKKKKFLQKKQKFGITTIFHLWLELNLQNTDCV